MIVNNVLIGLISDIAYYYICLFNDWYAYLLILDRNFMSLINFESYIIYIGMKVSSSCQQFSSQSTSTLYNPITSPCTQLRTSLVPQQIFISQSSVIKLFVARSNAPPPSAATWKKKTKNHSGRLMWDTAKGPSTWSSFTASKLAQFDSNYVDAKTIPRASLERGLMKRCNVDDITCENSAVLLEELVDGVQGVHRFLLCSSIILINVEIR